MDITQLPTGYYGTMYSIQKDRILKSTRVFGGHVITMEITGSRTKALSHFGLTERPASDMNYTYIRGGKHLDTP